MQSSDRDTANGSTGTLQRAVDLYDPRRYYDVLSPRTAERFVEAYGRAGGVVELALYPGAGHAYARDSGPNTVRTIDTITSFIARQFAAMSQGWRVPAGRRIGQ